MRLTILHALEKNTFTTGSVVQMYEAARGQVAAGHRVIVVTRPGAELHRSCEEHGIHYAPLPFKNEFDFASANRLRRMIRRFDVDVIHVHKGIPHAVALIGTAGFGELPVLVVNRGVSFPLDRFNKWKYRHPRVGAVVCVAEAIRRIVIESGGLEEGKVLTVHAGTDTARFSPEAADPGRIRSELGLDDDALLVGQVSVRDWKGWMELTAAFASLAPRFPSARLLFVGCQPEAQKAKVEEAAAKLGVADRVLTLPFRSDMPDVLAACDVVADASWTGTGITGTIREAMALERAAVATDCAGNGELVIDGATGLLVPPKTPRQLAAALERLLADPELRRELGSAGRRRVEEGFSTRQRLERLEELYLRLVADRAAGRPKPSSTGTTAGSQTSAPAGS